MRQPHRNIRLVFDCLRMSKTQLVSNRYEYAERINLAVATADSGLPIGVMDRAARLWRDDFGRKWYSAIFPHNVGGI